MLHSSTIKAEVKKRFEDIKIIEVKKHSFGIFSVKVKKETMRSTKIGIIWGKTDHENFENGVDMDAKIEWL